jgi:hypothetical protein
MRPAQLLTVLEREFQAAIHGQHTPVMLWGPPGVGKSQMVAQVAKRHGMPVIDIRLSQMEPSDLRGIPFRVDGQVEWAVPSMLPDETRHGAQGILFLDEITSVPPSVSAAAYQLILDRRLGAYSVPDGWAIFAAGNRQGDRGVTYTMPAPLANRFSHFDVDINLDDWVAWAYANHIDDRLIAFLRFRPELLFEFDPAHNPVAFPSPRSWEFAHRALHKFGDVQELLIGALQACVGPAAGSCPPLSKISTSCLTLMPSCAARRCGCRRRPICSTRLPPHWSAAPSVRAMKTIPPRSTATYWITRALSRSVKWV